jgi:hypothetical protein
MTGIACRYLLRLREQNLFVTDQQGPEAFVFVGHRAKSLYVHDGSGACELNNSLVERHSAIERRSSPHNPISADDGRFHHSPDAEFDDERNNPRVRKIDAADGIARVSEDNTINELGQLQVGLNEVENTAGKRCE